MGLEQWLEKKQIKLEEEAISEILVADTNSESGVEASDVRRLFWGGGGGKEEEEEEEEEEEDITNNGQGNQPNCSAVCVLLAAKERAQCLSAPVHGALFRWISHKRKFVIRGLLEKYPTVFFYANTWWIII